VELEFVCELFDERLDDGVVVFKDVIHRVKSLICIVFESQVRICEGIRRWLVLRVVSLESLVLVKLGWFNRDEYCTIRRVVVQFEALERRMNSSVPYPTEIGEPRHHIITRLIPRLLSGL